MYTYTLIHVYKNPVNLFFENRFRSGQVDYFGVQKEVGQKKKETVVLILFEIQHPLDHWLAGDLDPLYHWLAGDLNRG
jgi:hypothetical protein